MQLCRDTCHSAAKGVQFGKRLSKLEARMGLAAVTGTMIIPKDTKYDLGSTFRFTTLFPHTDHTLNLIQLKPRPCVCELKKRRLGNVNFYYHKILIMRNGTHHRQMRKSQTNKT